MHHLTKAVHRREVSHLLAVIGWPPGKMGLTTVVVLERKVGALQGTVMRAAMIALKLMGIAVALGMMTRAPLMKMMKTTVATVTLKSTV